MSHDILGTLRRSGDRSSVSFDRVYQTTADDLWEAVTDPDRLERWMARVTGDLREGGTFTIHFDDNDTAQCRIESCSPRERFVWIWPHESSESQVEVEVVPDGDAARLRLVHSRLTQTQAPEYAAGWDVYLRRLTDDIAGTPSGDWWEAWETLAQQYRALP